jgi:hypothetical protein
MSKTTLSDADTKVLVREYARSLGLTDERALDAALHLLETHARRSSGRALEEAYALLRSWFRHPSHRAAAA